MRCRSIISRAYHLDKKPPGLSETLWLPEPLDIGFYFRRHPLHRPQTTGHTPHNHHPSNQFDFCPNFCLPYLSRQPATDSPCPVHTRAPVRQPVLHTSLQHRRAPHLWSAQTPEQSGGPCSPQPGRARAIAIAAPFRYRTPPAQRHHPRRRRRRRGHRALDDGTTRASSDDGRQEARQGLRASQQ